MALVKSLGVVLPPLAMIWATTEPPPALCPQIVTFLGSPPNLLMYLLTHCKAAC